MRIGDTVRRPAGPWTPAVHRLLAHLERAGFDGAPRALGVDEHGREIVGYLDGKVVWPDHAGLLADDEALAQVARLIRAYHDAVAGFDAGEGVWARRAADRNGPKEVLCHNDLGPWNLVQRPDRSWAFIDWDLAAPGRRDWDLAWALLGLVPLTSDRLLADDDVVRRLRVFAAAYGVADLRPVLDVAVERCVLEAAEIRGEGGRLLLAGHAEIWEASGERVRQHADMWAR